MSREVCVVTGVGPGTGSALSRRFAESHRVAMIARSGDRLAELEAELPESKGFACDVTDADALARTVEAIRKEMGGARCSLSNASRPARDLAV